MRSITLADAEKVGKKYIVSSSVGRFSKGYAVFFPLNEIESGTRLSSVQRSDILNVFYKTNKYEYEYI